MDISKLALEASKKAINDITERKDHHYPAIEDESLNKLVNQDKLLMIYTHYLLESYHEELSKALAKQGINI